MKMKIFILFILLLCSGCSSIKYNLTISKDKKIDETIIVIDDDYEKNTSDEPLVMSDMSSFEYFFQSLPYDVSIVKNNNYLVTKNFSSFDEFRNSSLVFSKFYDNNEIKFEKDKVSVNLKMNSKIKDYLKNNSIKSFEISLYIPYYVSGHNAKTVKNDTYTWKFDNLNDANIKINFDLGKDKNFKNFIYSLYTLIGFSIIIVIIVIYFVKKHNKNNEI